MGALSASPLPSTFASRPYLERLFENTPRVPKSTPTDPAARRFFAEIGERIRDAREAKGWRREDLAHHMGLGFKSIQNYEQGAVRLTRITQLAEVLGVDPQWLLHGDRGLLEQLEDVNEQLRELRALVAQDSPESAQG